MIYLYVLLYSIFRNSNPFVEMNDYTASILKVMGIGFLIWFIIVNLIAWLRWQEGRKAKVSRPWHRSDYFNIY